MAERLSSAEKKALSYKLPQHAAAFWRGFRAGIEDPRRFACPYMSGAYYNAWMAGWKAAADNKCERSIAAAQEEA